MTALKPSRASSMLIDLQKLRPYVDRYGDQPPSTGEIDFARLEQHMRSARAGLRHALPGLIAAYRRLHPRSPLFQRHTLYGPTEDRRRELSYTLPLAWLLNPRHHPWGARLLSAVLSSAFPDVADWPTVEISHVDAETHTVTGKRVDVVATGTVRRGEHRENWKLILEAKIDSRATDRQLAWYRESLREHPSRINLLVLLHPLHPPPTLQEIDDVIFRRMTWLQLAATLLGVLDSLDEDADNVGARDYLGLYIGGLIVDIEKLQLPLREETHQVDFVKFLEKDVVKGPM